MIKNHIVYPTFSDWRFNFTKAEGEYVWSNGNKYIDFTSGWNVANLGWNHPEINESVIKQIEKNVYAPIWTADPIQESYAAQLLQYMPREMDVVCRATNGTEAIEMAIKIARAASRRKKVIGFEGTYHGQLFAALALGFEPADTEAIGPLVPNFVQLQYPSATGNAEKDRIRLKTLINTLEELLAQKDVAAVVCEPELITGWGSCQVAVKGFTKAVRTVTQQFGTYMIVDEVGTGFSRTGKLFGYSHSDIVPDIITLAKGMSNGNAAIGTTVTSSNLVEGVISQTHLTSTFGWTPVACAAASKTLEIHMRDKTWAMAEQKGNYLRTTLVRELKNVSIVKEIRGIGLEIGVELFNNNAIDILRKSFAGGLHLAPSGTALLQIMPPLTISSESLDRGIEILIQSIKKTASPYEKIRKLL